MTKEKDRSGERVTLRVTSEFYARLVAAAEADRRSLSNFALVLLEDGLAARGGAPTSSGAVPTAGIDAAADRLAKRTPVKPAAKARRR